MLKESDFPTIDEIAACLEHIPARDDTPETLRTLAKQLREDALDHAATCEQLDADDTESEE